jgi:hypothetical protein
MVERNPYAPPAQIDAGPILATVATDGQYEFNDFENIEIGRTAGYTKVWGVIAIIVGVLSVLAVIGAFVAVSMIGEELDLAELGLGPQGLQVAIAALLPLAIVNLVVGWLYIGAGRSLGAVVDTAGNDVALMLGGLTRMASAFRIEAIVTLVAMVIGFVIGIALSVE